MKVLIIKDQELFIQKECIKSITSATNERGLVQGNCSLLYFFQSPGKKSSIIHQNTSLDTNKNKDFKIHFHAKKPRKNVLSCYIFT